MLSKLILAASVAVSFASAAMSNGGRPCVFKDIGVLSKGLDTNLPPTVATSEMWGAGWIPKDCKSIIEGQNLTATDVEVYNVHYVDCSSAWVMCRHKQSAVDINTMIEHFGRLPVKMRSVVRHLVSFPGDTSSFSAADNIGFYGNAANSMSILTHEVGHSLDSHGYPNIDAERFSSSSLWIDAYNQDTAVVSPYADTNQVENHGDEMIAALFDKNVPGGINAMSPKAEQIRNQVQAIQQHIGFNGDSLVPGGRCRERFAKSAPVPMTTNDSSTTSPAPDVSLSGDVKVLKPVSMPRSVNASVFNNIGERVGFKIVNLPA